MVKKIFPDRWFIWAVVTIVVGSISVWGYIQYAMIQDGIAENISVVPAAKTVKSEDVAGKKNAGAPQISILVPSSDTKWEIGSRQKISWTYAGEFPSLARRYFTIRFKCPISWGGKQIGFFENVPIEKIPSTIEWIIPDDLLERNDCKIEITYSTTDSLEKGGSMYPPEDLISIGAENKGNISIVTPGKASPSLKLLYPNGGESFGRTGKGVEIKWVRTKIGGSVRAELYKGEKLISWIPSDYDQIAYWDIGFTFLHRDFEPGCDYKIRIGTLSTAWKNQEIIKIQDGSPDIEDWSDTPFCIQK